jgi:hypothetical protein
LSAGFGPTQFVGSAASWARRSGSPGARTFACADRPGRPRLRRQLSRRNHDRHVGFGSFLARTVLVDHALRRRALVDRLGVARKERGHRDRRKAALYSSICTPRQSANRLDRAIDLATGKQQEARQSHFTAGGGAPSGQSGSRHNAPVHSNGILEASVATLWSRQRGKSVYLTNAENTIS